MCVCCSRRLDFFGVNPGAFGVVIWSFEHVCTHVPIRLPEVDDYLLSSLDEESPAVPSHCDSCLQRMKGVSWHESWCYAERNDCCWEKIFWKLRILKSLSRRGTPEVIFSVALTPGKWIRTRRGKRPNEKTLSLGLAAPPEWGRASWAWKPLETLIHSTQHHTTLLPHLGLILLQSEGLTHSLGRMLLAVWGWDLKVWERAAFCKLILHNVSRR